MERISSVRPTGKFPEKVENLKRWSRFPGGISERFSYFVPVPGPWSGTATYWGLRPNGTTFYQSEIPLLLPPKFPGFFPKWKAPGHITGDQALFYFFFFASLLLWLEREKNDA